MKEGPRRSRSFKAAAALKRRLVSEAAAIGGRTRALRNVVEKYGGQRTVFVAYSRLTTTPLHVFTVTFWLTFQ